MLRHVSHTWKESLGTRVDDRDSSLIAPDDTVSSGVEPQNGAEQSRAEKSRAEHPPRASSPGFVSSYVLPFAPLSAAVEPLLRRRCPTTTNPPPTTRGRGREVWPAGTCVVLKHPEKHTGLSRIRTKIHGIHTGGFFAPLFPPSSTSFFSPTSSLPPRPRFARATIPSPSPAVRGCFLFRERKGERETKGNYDSCAIIRLTITPAQSVLQLQCVPRCSVPQLQRYGYLLMLEQPIATVIHHTLSARDIYESCRGTIPVKRSPENWRGARRLSSTKRA